MRSDRAVGAGLALLLAACSSPVGPAGTTGAQALVRLDAEPPGPNCTYGGTAAKSGIDTNRDGTLQDGEVTSTQYVCSNQTAPAGWAASGPGPESGETPMGVWMPVGRSVSLYKSSDASRLKVTVSDNLRVGGGDSEGRGSYEVRMNDGFMTPRCSQEKYNWNARGASISQTDPFATVCVTDALPEGLYQFDVWVYSYWDMGTSYVGSMQGQPLVLVEEMPTDGSFAINSVERPFEAQTNSTAYVSAPKRSVSYTKASGSSLLKVTLADTFRVGYQQSGGWGAVMVRMDGADTTCSFRQYDAQNENGSSNPGDYHAPFVETCVLADVSAGQHAFDVFYASGNGGQVDLGWGRSYPLLLVEELSATGRSHSSGSVMSGEISSTGWSGVTGRSLTHNVTAGGRTVKLTYSDTFRAAAICNGVIGRFAVYLDNQETGCFAGQYSYNSGVTPAQDHSRPVNLTCLFRDLPAGAHTFSVWSQVDSASCSNLFGWGRGQNLLLAEELP